MQQELRYSEPRGRITRGCLAVFFVAISGSSTWACLGRLDFDVDDATNTRDAGNDSFFDTGSPTDTGENTFLDVHDDGAHNDAGDATNDVEPSIPTVELLHRDVFAVSCAPCHTDRVSGGLSLRQREGLYETLLEPSTQAPALARVAPGDLDGSYLWLKLNNTHEAVGGLGEQMPLSGALTPAQLAMLELWIVNGAPR